MNSEIEASSRRITVIVDPHIKAFEEYPVYSKGLALEEDYQSPSNVTNVFNKTADGTGNFYGDCWPGNSTWIDYLNENAQDFWGQQFKYENF